MRKIMGLIMALSMAFGVLLAGAPAQAAPGDKFNLIPGSWDVCKPVAYWVQQPVGANDRADISFAMQRIRETTGYQVVETSQEGLADIKFVFDATAQNFPRASIDFRRYAGYNRAYFYQGGTTVHLFNPNLTGNTGTGRAIVLHEIGHAFGLDHYSDANHDQVMEPMTPNGLSDYGDGDIMGLGGANGVYNLAAAQGCEPSRFDVAWTDTAGGSYTPPVKGVRDSSIWKSEPNTNRGQFPYLEVDNQYGSYDDNPGSEAKTAMMQFTVPPSPSGYGEYYLRVYVHSVQNWGANPRLRASITPSNLPWTENTVTYNNAPQAVSGVYGYQQPNGPGWVDILLREVNSETGADPAVLVSGSTVSLRVDATVSNAFTLRSSEYGSGEFAPMLVRRAS